MHSVHEIQLRAHAGNFEAIARGNDVRLYKKRSTSSDNDTLDIVHFSVAGCVTLPLHRLQGCSGCEVTSIAVCTPQLAAATLAHPSGGTAAGTGGALVVFDPSALRADLSIVQTIKLADAQRVTAAAFSPDAAKLACAVDAKVVVFAKNATSGEWQQETESALHENFVTGVAFNPVAANCQLVSCAADGKLRFFEVGNGFAETKAVTPFEGGGGIATVAFTSDGKTVACGGQSGAIALVNATSGEVKATTITAHKDPITSLSFNDDGSRLLSAARDDTARIFDMPMTASASPRELFVFRGGASQVAGAAFSPDSKNTIAAIVSHETGELKLFQSANGELLNDDFVAQGTVMGGFAHALKASSLVFAPNSEQLVMGIGGLARVFHLRYVPIAEHVAMGGHVTGLGVASNNATVRITANAKEKDDTNKEPVHKILLAEAREAGVVYSIEPKPFAGLEKQMLQCSKCKTSYEKPPKEWRCDCVLEEAKRVRVWSADSKDCERCKKAFGWLMAAPRHHGRCCGRCLCAECTAVPEQQIAGWGGEEKHRVCIDCLARGVPVKVLQQAALAQQ